MSNSFEQPSASSKEQSSNEPERSGDSQKAFEQATEAVQTFLSSLEERVEEQVAENPVIHLQGREWKLENIDEEYQSLAREQARHILIKERLEQAFTEKDEAKQMSVEDAQQYFVLQILSHIEEMQEKKAALKAQTVQFEKIHPEMHKKLFEDT